MKQTKMDRLIAAFDARFPWSGLNESEPAVNEALIEKVVGFKCAKKAVSELRKKIVDAKAPYFIRWNHITRSYILIRTK